MATAFKYFVNINSQTLKNDFEIQLNNFSKDNSVNFSLNALYGSTYTLQMTNAVSAPYLFQGTIQEIVYYWNSAMFYFNFVPPNPLLALLGKVVP